MLSQAGSDSEVPSSDFSDLVDFEEEDGGYEGGAPASSDDFDALTEEDDADPAVDDYQG